MKFYDLETGNHWCVESFGQSKDGTHYAVVDQNSDPVIEIPPLTNKLEMEKQLVDFAKKRNLIPEFIYKVKNGERVLQGKVTTCKDSIQINDTQRAKYFDRYLAIKTEISAIESDTKRKIDELKQDAKERIKDREGELETIEKINKTGFLGEDCKASWERDITNGIMLLVRHDNLKVLSWRYMDDQERQIKIDDQEAQESNTAVDNSDSVKNTDSDDVNDLPDAD